MFDGRHTRHILLAQSALLRKAGDAFALGLAKDGTVVDQIQENLGYGFLQAALETDRMMMTFCPAQTNPLTNASDTGYDLRGNLYEAKANAGDVYDAAAKAEAAAQSLSPTGEDC